MGVVARRGIGSDYQVRSGFLAVPLHYYQPVFDPSTIPDAVWTREHDLVGIDFAPRRQLELLANLGGFGHECRWPEYSGTGYYASNSSFGYSSAALLHGVLRYYQPKRVIEVGAGMSTLLITAALELNGREGSLLTTIDPNPREQVTDLPERCAVLVANAQDVPLEVYGELERNDILFIDSSHVIRTGGDVNFLYLDVLPKLRPGVIVHIHDVILPYEYSREYAARTDGPRLYWTEQYLLQAFLTQNPCWEVLLAGHWLQHDHPMAFASAFPHWRPDAHRISSSFYIRSTGGGTLE